MAVQNQLQSLTRPQHPRHRAVSFFFPPSLCQDPTEAMLQVALAKPSLRWGTPKPEEECPGAREVPTLLPCSFSFPLLTYFTRLQSRLSASGYGPPVQHPPFHSQKLSINAVALRSQCHLTKSSLWGKYWGNFMTGGEALSARLLGLRGWCTGEDTGLGFLQPDAGRRHPAPELGAHPPMKIKQETAELG